MDAPLDLALGSRSGPAFVVALLSMVLPPAIGAYNAPSHLTLVHLVPPLLLMMLLPWPAVLLTLHVTARGRVFVAGNALTWSYDDRSGRMDLAQPVEVDAWIDARGSDDEISCVVLALGQGESRVAVAYTVHRDRAPDLPLRVGEEPVYLLVSLRARRAWEALEQRVRAAGR